ncbi:3-hydroxyacyl-CoA dehydrogenase NAD-binding domain-containing protein [Niveibacterium umoris]|uniref:3-hydroxyacyl-CoA dehydrogenase/enoyl-CoA hydratase/3-hydroxybutyryl-CoA epimerase n=1 Tax=Niveibacterium umoris TaxID=1193620 RepID=A0A840BMK3_9RHOO|nr:3-hydroxyacyl-CoA dehydrogenase NAD-binding domain-containing protein [Niveibacterium umoris]MBB4014465.1 3-hydroxyacyl-CoA dehydrogenase/enoyl-CoA hydratase/3-hydroxybutyryl-CoA epimerase [Niveibacterium umoris]
MQGFKHWQLQRDADGLAWATLDAADGSANTLGREVMEELGGLLDQLDREPPKGLVIRSGKAAGFIAGANIEEFTKIATVDDAKVLVKRGWDLFNRLAAVKYPTLALVRGHCMGGGLELALACRYRVAVDEPGTKMALPEVMLGIVPGWGGMLRLPEVVGPAAAMDMMLTGKNIDAKRARKMGLADECVPPRVMENTARMVVLSARPRRELPFMQKLMLGPLKGIVANGAKKQVAKRARPEHYPAPYAIIDIWSKFGGNALAVPANDPASLESVFGSATAKNLIRVFFLQDRLKAFGKDSDFAPKHVHVIGAGVMGGDIAAVCAAKGMTVTLQDQSVERIAPAIKRAAEFYAKRYRGDKKQVRFALDRLIADPQGAGVAQADVIIEAIFENLEVKQKVFADVEARAKPDAVIATNTSSLKLEDIAATFRNPSRLVGIHFFNPVPKMPLVEVVTAENSDADAAKKAAAFVRKIDKLPLPVKSAPGFLVNAVLGPYLLEAMRCVDEGIAPEAVDAAALAFGMPMGPIELADTVGLDIAMAAGKGLTGAAEPPKKLAELMAAGNLGKKSGKGFYTWVNGKPQKSQASAPSGLADRLVKPLLDATQRCVNQGVVGDADLADAGVIFGTGFAPFRGGPMNYLKNKAA